MEHVDGFFRFVCLATSIASGVSISGRTALLLAGRTVRPISGGAVLAFGVSLAGYLSLTGGQ